jgi:hypothetical protein
LYRADPQARQHDRQDLPQRLRTVSPTGVDLLQLLVKRPGFGRVFARRQVVESGLQVAEHVGHGGIVRAMKRNEFVEEIVPALDAGMAKDLDGLDGAALEADAGLFQGVT